MTDGEKRVQVAFAELLARGLIQYTVTGIKPTPEGLEEAARIWDRIPDGDKLLLIPYLRKELRLVYQGEGEGK